MAGVGNTTLEEIRGMLCEIMQKLNDILAIVQVVPKAQSESMNHHESNSGATESKRYNRADLKAQTVRKERRQFTELYMPLNHAFSRVAILGLLSPLDLKPLPNPLPHRFKENEYCAFHQSRGHDTNHCYRLRHEIQDLIDRGVINFSIPTNNPNILQSSSMNPFLATVNPISPAQPYANPLRSLTVIKQEFLIHGPYHSEDTQTLASKGVLDFEELYEAQGTFNTHEDLDSVGGTSQDEEKKKLMP